MLNTIDLPVVGGDNSSCDFFSTSLSVTEIHAEASQVTMDEATPSGSYVLDLPGRQILGEQSAKKRTNPSAGAAVGLNLRPEPRNLLYRFMRLARLNSGFARSVTACLPQAVTLTACTRTDSRNV